MNNLANKQFFLFGACFVVTSADEEKDEAQRGLMTLGLQSRNILRMLY